jgi:hypothetical protein
VVSNSPKDMAGTLYNGRDFEMKAVTSERRRKVLSFVTEDSCNRNYKNNTVNCSPY